MRILSISSDKKIFEKDSLVLQRAKDQASLVSALTIVVFTLRKDQLDERKDGNLRIIPTGSVSKLLYILDAYNVGRKIVADIVTVQDPFESALVGLLLKLKTKAKLQIQIHTDFLSPYFNKESFLNRIRSLISYITIPRADALRVVSERIKRSVQNKFKKVARIEVLPVFRDFVRPDEAVYPHLHKKYPQFGFIMLAVGRLEPEKNLSMLLESFAKAQYMIPDAGLVIVGEGSERLALRERAKELGIEEKVKFEGWRNDLIVYYKSADLFISTSNFEGYGLTFLEAAYYGCPILSTDVGIMGEVFKDNVSALICPVGDTDCISSKMAEIRTFVDVRRRIADGGKAAARSAVWNKENYMKRYLKLWKNCL